VYYGSCHLFFFKFYDPIRLIKTMPNTIMAVSSNENAPFRSYGVGYFLHYFLYIRAYARVGGGCKSIMSPSDEPNQTKQPTNQTKTTKPNKAKYNFIH